VSESGVDTARLRRFVVRISEPTTEPDAGPEMVLGTGFFVAPGWVLTAAHVLAAPYGGLLEKVTVTPADPAVGDQPAPACVRARSQPPAGLVVWPFPDMALLQIQHDTDPAPGWVTTHPCVWLDETDPAQPVRQRRWAYGFPPRESDHRPGEPVSFEFEGVTGDGFLQLRAGLAQPGLSGAPLVCPTRRAVVGVVTASRNINVDLGGWAGPVATGLKAEALAEQAGHVMAAGREWVLADRGEWHRVFPVSDADKMVERPWEWHRDEPLRPGAGQPSVMLRPEYALVDYLFRDSALAMVAEWCARRERLSVRYIDAVGGAGKTRFAVEACRAQQERGWMAGLLPADNMGADTAPLPRLLVVDYIEERDATAMAGRLAVLAGSATELAPVRVLLLSRPAAGAMAGQSLAPLTEVASGPALIALDNAVDATTTAVGDLTGPQRQQLFDSGLTAFGRTWHGPDWTAPKQNRPDLSDPRYGRPLDVLLEAFDAALADPHRPHDPRPPIDRALDHEARRWYAHPHLNGLDKPLIRRCVALATLAGARDVDQARVLLDLALEDTDPAPARLRARIDKWLCGLYSGPDRWNPLRPDRLGEALITRVLAEQPDNGSTLLAAVLALPHDRQVARALDVLIRLSTQPAVADIAAPVLARAYPGLTARLYPTEPPGDSR
jgi:hypothetical protein